MATHERSLEVNAPAERVWRIWSDPSTWPDWNPDVVAIKLDGPFATGTTGSMTTRAGGTHAIRLGAVEAGGPLGPLFSAMMGRRIADGFEPLLGGLARAAAGAGTDQAGG